MVGDAELDGFVAAIEDVVAERGDRDLEPAQEAVGNARA
jgi:hypothetical protein